MAPFVPPPTPPGSDAAWYAPAVTAQYTVHPGIVATVTARDGARPTYELRRPQLSARDADALADVCEQFADATLPPPLTRADARDRLAAGFEAKHRRVIAALTDATPAARRRITVHALCEARCLGDLAGVAADDRVTAAVADDETVVVHTDAQPPAATGLPANTPAHDRLRATRIAAYTVPFRGFDVPVRIYRTPADDADAFTTTYAVREPDRLPGDDARIAACKDRIWTNGVATGDSDAGDDHAAAIADRARSLLARRHTAPKTRHWCGAVADRVREAVADRGPAVPPVGDDHVADLAYYVVRDLVGDAELTIPIRDPNLEDVEANRVGERVKVVARDRVHAADDRIPTNLVLDDEQRFVDLVTGLAAQDGVELNAATPSAKVNLEPDGVADDVTIRCAVALPAISEGGPHVSIRKQAADALTPVDLLRQGSLTAGIVALLWLAYEHHRVVLFSGPTGVGKTTLMNAHMPFVPFDDRPVSIDEGSREVRLPHETGVSLSTREHEQAFKRVSMADLMTATNYLNPDIEVIAEINTRASFESFAQILNTGHGVVGTTHAAGVDPLVNRAVEQGVPAHLLREIDLVVFPRRTDGDRYVGEVVEFVDDAGPATTAVETDATTVHVRRIATRGPAAADEGLHSSGEYAVRDAEDVQFFDAVAARTDRAPAAVRREFARKRRYVRALDRAGVTDFEALFERVAARRRTASSAEPDGGGPA
ncbi:MULTISPECIES: type II/IV secretion system ATPase subunit [Halobacterium]|nr:MULTISPECIES: type II/IV secretion system ATPase subunit [Halobacterium]MCF2166123.1 type II/IV secretion system ATPase subunit [Halobacterium salinarum]MCF2166783.1 type II/IV secretion system ATPase subunit [Halobacterium salinarum]MCF2208472.1 type II/IV secretion system ATPase subunit [Halobacterium salinarum]QRY22877.1 type II/IV secretion system ATPase subunit [Halobacterium sp. GSL-19]WJK64173.1 type II/IV secretion system ATPase subunit [Halobacterium salinarum]